MSNLFLRMPKLNPVHLMHGVTIAHNSTWVEVKKARWGKKNKTQMHYETCGLEQLADHFKSNQDAFNFAMDSIVQWEFYITMYCTTPNGMQYNRYLPVFRETTSFKLAAGFIESSVIPMVKTKDCVEYGYYGLVTYHLAHPLCNRSSQ